MDDSTDTLDAALEASADDDAEAVGDGARKKGASWTDPEPIP